MKGLHNSGRNTVKTAEKHEGIYTECPVRIKTVKECKMSIH